MIQISATVLRYSSVLVLALLGIALLTPATISAQTGPLNLPGNPSFNLNSVLAVAEQSDGKLLVGGNFTQVNGVAQPYLTRRNADGTRDTTWTAAVNGAVRAMAITGNQIYLGGDFTTVNGLARNRLAKLSLVTGEVDGDWNPNANNTVNTLIPSGGYLYVGGSFTGLGSPLVTYNRLARVALSGAGNSDPSWIPNANNSIQSLKVSGDYLYVAGNFTTLNSSARYYLGRFTLPDGTLDGAWGPTTSTVLNGPVLGMAVDPTFVYVGGAFTTSGGARNRLARFNVSGGSLDSWNPNANNLINALALNGSQLYVGGNFTSFGTAPATTRNRLARFSASTGVLDPNWNPNGGSTINAITLTSTRIFTGGAFTTMGGISRNRFAAFPVDGNANGNIVATLSTAPEVYVATGNSTQLNVTAVGSAPLTYQWYLGSSGDVTQPVEGATAASYSTPTFTENAAYWVRVTNSAGSADSATINVIVGSPPAIIWQPGDVTLLPGGSAFLSVVVDVTGPLTYQWYQGSAGQITNPVGDNARSYGTGALYGSTQFWVRVSNLFGNADSDAATVLVGNPPTITSHPVSQTAALGSNVSFTGDANGASEYQWLKNGSPIAGANDVTLVLSNVSAVSAGSYRLKASNPYGSVTSSEAILTVLTPPIISSQPLSQSTVIGGSVTFSVTAGGQAPLTYQWRRNFLELPGQTGPTLALTNIQPADAGDYTVVITNSLGSVTSNIAVLTLNAPPSITQQPQSANVATGQNRSLSVMTSGTMPMNYTWYRGASGDTSQPAGGTATSFTTPPLTTTTSYWVRVSNAYGMVDSATAILTVGDPPTILQAPQPQTVLAGFTAVFSVTAGGTPPYLYQWKKDGEFLTDPVLSSSYTVLNARESSEGSYSVMVTNAFGSVPSAGAPLTVNSPPTISMNPQPLLLNVGANGSFTVSATGTGPLTYQWKKDGEELPGETSASLDILAVDISSEGIYTVTVSNIFGNVTSAGAALQLNSPPVIQQAPISRNLVSGLSTTLNASVVGSAPFSYQWYRGMSGDTAEPVGSNAASFTTPPLTATASYWLRISNPFGSADTAAAVITVGQLPVILTQPVSQAVISGANCSFTVAVEGTAPLTYLWFEGSDPISDGIVDNTVFSGADGPSLLLEGVQSAAAGDYSVRITNAFGSVISDVVSLTVNVPPMITVAPLPQIVAAGGTANFSVTAMGTGPVAYQWQKNETDIPGANNPALVVTNAQLADEGGYRVVVTSDYGVATSTVAQLTVNTPPAIFQQPPDRSIFAGQTSTITVVATGTGPLVYQWYEGEENDVSTPVGIDSSIYQTPVLTSTRQYWVMVSNSFGSVQSGTITVTALSTVPVIDSGLSVTAPVGRLFRYRITASHTPTLFTAAPLPDGLGLDSETGWITGLPTASGMTSVVLTAGNSSGSGTATLTLTITPAVPVITSATTARGRAGENFNYQITGTNGPFTSAALGLPGNLIVGSASGLISGIPQAAGTFTIQLSAENAGGTGLALLTLTIDPGTVPPAITSASFASGKVSVPFAFQLRANQSPTGFLADGLPAGFTLNPGTGLITGTPLVAGDFSVSVSASNLGGSGAVQTWNLGLNPPAGVPVITSAGTATGRRGGEFAFQITATNAATVYSVSPSLPDNLVLNSATGLISGTTTTSGNFTVQLTAANVLGSRAPTPLIITVGSSILAPVLSNSASVRGFVGLPYSLHLSAAPAATQFGATHLPPGLNLDSDSGEISGTPLESGTWIATVNAGNASGLGPDLAITFTIGPPLTAPVLPPDMVIRGNVGTPLRTSLTATQPPVSFSATALPAGLSFDPENGLIAGTPLARGETLVTVTAENPAGSSAPTGVTFRIDPPIGSPEIISNLVAEGSLDLPFSYRISTTPAATRLTAGPLPSGLTFSGDLISGTPEVSGTYDIALTASNAAGEGWPRVLRLQIRAGNALPRITSTPAASATAGVVFSYQAAAINGPITAFRAESLPVGLRLDPQAGVITGTPSEPGIFTIPLSASNANGAGDPLNLVLTVAPATQTPVVYGENWVLGFVGQELFYRIEATDLSANASFAASDLPPGLHLNNSTGMIIGTPTAEGEYSAKVWAQNSAGAGAKFTVNFKIINYDSAFKILRPGYLSGVYGQPLVLDMITTSAADSFEVKEYDPAFFQPFTAQGTNSQFTLIPKRAGRTFFQPHAYKSPTYDWISTVVDILPSASQPVITSPTLAYGTVGQTFTYSATATNQPTSFGVRNALPPGLGLSNIDGIVSGTPTAPGVFTVVLDATNAGGTGAPRELVIVVQAAPGTPLITGGSSPAPQLNARMQARSLAAISSSAHSTLTNLTAFGQVGQFFNYALAASGEPLRFQATGLPSGLALNEATGEIAGVPAVAGTFPVQVSASNAAGAGDVITLTLDIAAAAGTPVVTSVLNVVAQVGQAFSHTITASPAALGFTAAGLPAPLTLDSATGVISGTPEEPGDFTVLLSGANALGNGGIAQLTLTILAAPGTPVVTSPVTAAGVAGGTFSFQLTASNEPIAFHLDDLPFGLIFDSVSGLISGTPQMPGALQVVVRAENAVGMGQAAMLEFDIAPNANSPTLTSASSVVVVVGAPFTFQLTASQSPTSFNHGVLPAGLNLVPATGLLGGTAVAPGDYPVTVSANNASGTGGAQTLTIHALVATNDTDNDGLNDVAEWNMAALGFDWQVSQPALVATYIENANGAGLFTPGQLQAQNGGTSLIAPDPVSGRFKLTMDWKKSTSLTDFIDFPAPPGSAVSISPAGDIEFEFTSPDNAAFFRTGVQ